jgi:hypothetical protein
LFRAFSVTQSRIACEIAITTTRDHELGNVEKYIVSGYHHILLVGRSDKQVAALGKSIRGGAAASDCTGGEAGEEETRRRAVMTFAGHRR